MSELSCPEGMKLISGEVKYYDDEKANWDIENLYRNLSKEDPFCIDETEVTNGQYDYFVASKNANGFELIVNRNGSVSVEARGDDEAALRQQANQLISFDTDVTSVEIKPKEDFVFELTMNKRGSSSIVARDAVIADLREQARQLISANSDVTGIEIKPIPASVRPKKIPTLDGPNQPVVNINWHSAKEYCEAKGGDLPTSRQWRKAATGPQGFDFASIDGELPTKGIFRNVPPEFDRTANVKSTLPNGYGVYEMTGNVSEWTLEKRSYDVDNGMMHLGGSFRTYHKSDDWYDRLKVFRSGTYSDPDQPEYDIGFRCVSSPINL